MHTTSRRRFAARLVVPVAAATLLAACGGDSGSGGGGGGSSDGPDLAAVSAEDLKGTKITLGRFFGDCEATTKGVTDVSKATTECESIQILINAFNAENENGITVERLGGAESNTYYDTLNAAYAGDSAPDVAVMHGSRIPEYAERNLLLPLDDQLGATQVDLDDATAPAREAVTHEDKTYALPFDIHAALAHVNVDLFEQAGLVDAQGAPVMPTSPEEFLAQAKQMKERTGKDYFTTARVKDGLGVHLWRSLVEQQGGSILDESGEVTVETPEAKTALAFVDQVFSSGAANGNQTYDTAQQAFLAGETAMLMNGTWVVDQYTKDATFDYRAMDFPTLYEKPAIWGDSHTWAIPRQQSPDPARYRAALEFASYMYEHSGDWAVHTGHLAARTSVLESPEYQQAPQRANYVATGTTNMQPVPRIQAWQAVMDSTISAMDSHWFGDASADEALKTAQRAVESEVSR